MSASSAAVAVSRPWTVRLLLVSAGALATVALSTGTAHADTHLVGDVVKQVHAVVKSTHHSVQRTPARAAAPVRHTVSTVAKTSRQVAPVQRVAPRNSSVSRPVTTTVQRLANTTSTARVAERAPAKKVVHLAVKPLRMAAVKTPVSKTLAVKVPAVKTPAVDLPAVQLVVVDAAPLLTTVDRVVAPVVSTRLLEPVVAPVLQVVTPVLAVVPLPLGPIVAAPLPGVPVVRAPALPAVPVPVTSGVVRSVVGVAPAISTAAIPVLNDPAPIVSGAGSATSRSGVTARDNVTGMHAVDRLIESSAAVVLGGLTGLVLTVAGAAASGSATAGSPGFAGFAVLVGGLLSAAATVNRRFRDGLRLSSWAFAKHPGFAPD